MISRQRFAIALMGSLACFAAIAVEARAEDPPNIVFIMSDELAYFELSHMGNQKIHTPRIDQMAREGMRFTHAFAGSPVCAPLRCTLMTGKHSGHASVRANDGGTPLREDEVTIAALLKEQGYATGGFGKWGCGGRDSTGVPENHGFDEFFGYYDQVHAHSFYPPYLIRNSEEVVLEGNEGGREGSVYSHYEIMNRGLQFIRDHQDGPFFCYFPITPPHGMYDIPADDPAWDLYREDDWMQEPRVTQDAKNYAAMVSMVDRNVGEVLDLLRELDLEDNTIVFFTGDNGGQDRFRRESFPRGYFGPNVDPRTGAEFRGGKGNLYDGGLRIPFLVRWPAKIDAGQVSGLRFFQPDVLPTLAELAGARIPDEVDGISILPEILGEQFTDRAQEQHEYLYWEFGEQIAVRANQWKAIRPGKDRAWELYQIDVDISETNDLSAQHPEIVERLMAFAEEAHEPVRPGVYLDENRTRHERDRWAKWGTSRDQSSQPNRRMNRIRAENLIPAERMEIVTFSSENRSNDRLAGHAIDGRAGTVWHTQFTGQLKEHPHEIVIDLGASYDIRGFHYLARQDGGWNGAFAETEFYVGDESDEWGEPDHVATFEKNKQAQSAELEASVAGRYVRIRILSEVNGGPWSSAAEIGIVGLPLEDEPDQNEQ